MSVDTLIERLHKVKRTGNGRWMARKIRKAGKKGGKL